MQITRNSLETQAGPSDGSTGAVCIESGGKARERRDSNPRPPA
jgi:hypothetical protein